MNRLLRAHLALLAITLLLSACGAGKLYKSALPHNLKVTTSAQKVSVSLAIYGVDAQCQTNYQGSVSLQERVTELGIATGKPLYLVATFSSSSFLGGSSSSTSYETALTPRPGFRYEMALRYLDGIYNVVLFEIARNSGKRRELESHPLAQCGN